MITADTTNYRKELEQQFGRVWNTDELTEEFQVKGFALGLVVVKRKSDGKIGSLDFSHMPRFYYNFLEDS